MMTNLHETGWHDDGQIAGWIYRYSNHIKNANAYAEASRWAAGLIRGGTNGAYLAGHRRGRSGRGGDLQRDVLAVVEPIGGRVVYVFAEGPGDEYSVVGNCNVFWVDTEGDYNETNHVAALSDVSVAGVNREHDLYSLEIVQGSGTTVSLRLVHPNVTKTVSLTEGDKYLDVIWDAAGQDTYVKSGLSPDLVDLVWNAQLDRVWDPAGGSYFGQRNPNSGATSALVVGDGGASHNLQYTSDAHGGGGVLRAADSSRSYLFAGETAPPDGGGSHRGAADRSRCARGLAGIRGASGRPISPAPTSSRSVRRGRYASTRSASPGSRGRRRRRRSADVTCGAGCAVRTMQDASVRLDIDLDRRRRRGSRG